MAEDKEVTAQDVLGSGKKRTFSQDDVAAIVREATRAAREETSEGFAKLAEALLESRKPYKDPRDLANEQIARNSLRDMAVRKKKAEEFAQRRCSHIQGAHPLSQLPNPYGFTAIVLHRLSTGEVFGVCNLCGRQWFPEDKDYEEWILQKRSANSMSEAGRRMNIFTQEAILAGRPLDRAARQ